MRPFRVCFRGLMATLRPLKWKVALSCALGLVEVALSLSFVAMSKRVVDVATGADTSMGMWRAVAIFAGIALAQVAAAVASRYWDGWLEVNSRNAMRSSVFSKVMNSIWTGRDRLHSGDTMNRLEEDIRVVTEFVVSSFPQIIVTVCRFIAATFYLFWLSPELGWTIIFIMPLAALGSRLFFRKMRSLTMEIREGDSRAQSHMQENIQHRMVVRSLGGIDDVVDTLDEIQDEILNKTVTRLNYSAISRALMHLGFVGGYAAAFIWSAHGLMAGTVGFGAMTAFLQLVGQVQRPVANLTSQIPAFIRALSSEDRLLELIGMEQENKVQDILLPGAPGIRARGLSFKYADSDEFVFRGMDFDLEPGSFTAITGPTGSGKSTLVKVIMSLLKPVEGIVELYDPPTPSGAATMCNFMYVPQGNSLMSGSIRQNLQLAKPDASDEELWAVLDTAAAEFVRNLPEGLDTLCSEVGGGLSEGQAQRIAIARALLRPGGVLVLDEATSALDSATEDRLLQNLSKSCGGNKTVLCITHRPAAEGFASGELKLV